ncbi:hypothetical protein ACTNEO_07595 [Gracilibacillus sp. HCP3S3_G5_1]|uniref:hypothetical protein n=1 Tax=unclassified Gracilibacillus TaxID=2625209 RepID=UPI003F89BB97
MNDLLSFIVPILAILFWVFGLSKSKEQQQDQQRPSSPPRVDQQTTSHTQQQKNDTARPEPDYQSIESTIESAGQTFAQQKEKQMEKLKEKIQQAENIRDKTRDQELGIHDAIKDGPKPKLQRKSNAKELSLSVEKNLTSKGIAQGIFMSEVLGPPRAYQKRKYYRNYR